MCTARSDRSKKEDRQRGERAEVDGPLNVDRTTEPNRRAEDVGERAEIATSLPRGYINSSRLRPPLKSANALGRTCCRDICFPPR